MLSPFQFLPSGLSLRVNRQTPWDSRKGQYAALLKRNIVRPLSVDENIWPLALNETEHAGTHLSIWVLESAGSQSIPATHMHPAELHPSCISTAEGQIFLGYDVADSACLSGLTNCGYSGATLERLSQEFSQSLNDYHLFTNLNEALKFRLAVDTTVQEHAPFRVFALFDTHPQC